MPPRSSIVFAIQHYPPHPGGAEKQAAILAAHLAPKINGLDLLTSRAQSDEPAAEVLGYLKITRLPAAGSRLLFYPVNFLSAFFHVLLFGGRWQIIHAHCLSAFTLGALLAGRMRGCSFVVKLCSIGPVGDIAAIRKRIGGSLLWRIFRGADLFIAPTSIVAKELIAYGVGVDKIKVIDNVLDRQTIEGTHTPDDKQALIARWGLQHKNVVLYVGRLAPDKNLGVLMTAWEHLVDRGDCALLLVGDGPDAARIRAWRDKLPSPDSVVMVGQVSSPAIYYDVADVFVFPSRSETFGNAIVEAMWWRLPVISTRVGILDAWGGTVGGVQTFSADEPLELSRLLAGLLANPEQRRELGNAAREKIAKHFDTEKVAEQYKELYAELMK